MSITLTTNENGYLDGFDKFREIAPGKDIDWLMSLRESAIARFSELGFPTVHNEDWRFTNVTPIARTTFQMPENVSGKVKPDVLSQFTFPGIDCSRLVFIDGLFSSELSSIRQLPNGVKALSLSQALTKDQELLSERLGKYVDFDEDAFSALNSAFFQDGGFIFVPKGTQFEDPVHLLYVTTNSKSSPAITNPRNLIVVEDNCEANIIEHYVCLTDGGAYLSNVVTELILGQNSTVGHYLIENESKDAYNISTLRVQQERSSNMRSHSVLIGGALVRNNVHPVLAGEGCDSLINGLFMSSGRQHMDNYMKVEHASPHCDSRQFYNGILDGRSRGVFHGRIIVHEDAQKTDAKQTNRNLLLSDTAQIDTKPQLEIYADDVKCTHGATIGQIDENALFYIRSRGISEEASKDIILNAFTNETLESMNIEAVKRYSESLAADWFARRQHAHNG